MKSLKSKKLHESKTASKHQYTIPWTDGGIDPSTNQDHKDYVDKMCSDFVSSVKGLIEKHKETTRMERVKEAEYTVTIKKSGANDENGNTKVKKTSVAVGPKDKNTPFAHHNDGMGADMFMGFMQMKNIIYAHEEVGKESFTGKTVSISGDRAKLNAEILHHLSICKMKCDTFCGRENEMEKVKKFILADGSFVPLVIHAPSGAGKTAFTAMIAKMTKTWKKTKSVTIIRFLGTSPTSSTLLKMLGSVCEHICAAYGEPFHKSEVSTVRKSSTYFTNMLTYVSAKYGNVRPLYIILDSVDQLSPINGAHFLKWLPKVCPANIKIIISLIPEISDLLKNAKQHLKSKTSFVPLEEFSPQTACQMVEIYLKHKKRTLTDAQMNILKDAMQIDANPLLVKLWLDEASMWGSFTDMTQTRLVKTVREAIVSLFSRLEDKYGACFIKSTLGYVTLCKDGITEIELEDALSCNDEILNEVYRYHDPPVEGIVRIPPLLWARVRNDLVEYIVERQSQSRSILAWYHRQFIDSAIQRYGSTDQASKLHQELAQMFQIVDVFRKTITLKHRKLTVPDADRGVDAQPLVAHNTRKLVAIIYHLHHAGNMQGIKAVLLDINYLQCLIEALALPRSRQEVGDVLDILGVDSETQIILKAINLAQPIFFQDTSSFPVQLLGQILAHKKESEFIAKLCEATKRFIESCGTPQLMPLTACIPKSGAALKWSMEGPCKVFNYTSDGKQALVGTSSSSVLCQLIDSYRGSIMRTLPRSNVVGKELVLQGFISEQSDKVFILLKSNVLIWVAEDGGSKGESKVQYQSTNVNKKGALNSLILVSKDDRYIILAGPARMAMFEDANGEYRCKKAMDFAGCVETSNIVFSDDTSMTLSSHSIKGKAKDPFGAIVCWDFWDEKLKVRVAVSAPVVSGCLYKLPQIGLPDVVLCGCTDGKLFTVDMREGKVLKQFANTPFTGQRVMSCFNPQNSTMALYTKDAGILQIWDAVNTSKTQEYKIDTDSSGISFIMEGTMIAMATDTGTMLIYEIESGKMVASLECHKGAITGIIGQEDTHIVTVGKDNNLHQWSVEHVINPEQDAGAQKSQNDTSTLDDTDIISYGVINGGHLVTGMPN